jgi:hypothetical protein
MERIKYSCIRDSCFWCDKQISSQNVDYHLLETESHLNMGALAFILWMWYPWPTVRQQRHHKAGLHLNLSKHWECSTNQIKFDNNSFTYICCVICVYDKEFITEIKNTQKQWPTVE